ncbi:MAG: 3-hydroxyacyl-CoA dehydrogenase NAD-binding domain-containing protein [Mariprofundaceae bacterium]|nr:3-hydroxyacyl-CoA dehydrogenase NAD-binding domain-containing protein [Mariprofundaceae bacterium]
MEVVTLVREGEVARLSFSRSDKSVNVLDELCMEQLEAHIEAIEKETPEVLLLESAMPGCFIAGADLTLIQSVADAEVATRLAERGQSLCRRIELLSSTSIAVVEGACMGGGLELAMSCDHIVAVHGGKTSLGLPEIKIGIHPGFGGCVRLPKRVGWPKAIEMILTGAPVDAGRAKRIGLAQLVCHPEQVNDAVKFLAGSGKVSRAQADPWWFHLWPVRKFFFYRVRERALARFRHLDIETAYPAVPGAIDLLEDIYGMSDGLAYAREAESLGKFAVTPTCKNLIRVFFLGEALKKQDMVKKGKGAAAGLKHAVVYGAGVMGSGIGWVASRTGEVDLHDVSGDALGHGMKLLAKLAVRDPARLQRIRPVLDSSGLAASDVIIEAVLEDIAIKKQLWAEVEKHVSRDTLLLTNTSSLSVTDQQAGLKYPGRLAGLHFFNPAPKMPLVEVVAGARSTKKSVQMTAALAAKWGKFPVVVADRPGFLVNRCLMPFMIAALRLLENGQKLEHIDGALKNFGMPMGAIELADRVGLDICRHVGTHLSESYGERMRMPAWFEQMVTDGLLGVKSGKGFYLYAGEKRKGPNPELFNYLKLEPQPEKESDASLADSGEVMADAVIVNATLVPMLVEALACLSEDVVDSAEHLDAAMIYGIGFPPFRGGLLHYFSTLEKSELIETIRASGMKLPSNTGVLYG